MIQSGTNISSAYINELFSNGSKRVAYALDKIDLLTSKLKESNSKYYDMYSDAFSSAVLTYNKLNEISLISDSKSGVKTVKESFENSEHIQSTTDCHVDFSSGIVTLSTSSSKNAEITSISCDDKYIIDNTRRLENCIDGNENTYALITKNTDSENIEVSIDVAFKEQLIVNSIYISPLSLQYGSSILVKDILLSNDNLSWTSFRDTPEEMRSIFPNYKPAVNNELMDFMNNTHSSRFNLYCFPRMTKYARVILSSSSKYMGAMNIALKEIGFISNQYKQESSLSIKLPVSNDIRAAIIKTDENTFFGSSLFNIDWSLSIDGVNKHNIQQININEPIANITQQQKEVLNSELQVIINKVTSGTSIDAITPPTSNDYNNFSNQLLNGI